jgi:hypothetical protein
MLCCILSLQWICNETSLEAKMVSSPTLVRPSLSTVAPAIERCSVAALPAALLTAMTVCTVRAPFNATCRSQGWNDDIQQIQQDSSVLATFPPIELQDAYSCGPATSAPSAALANCPTPPRKVKNNARPVDSAASI